MSAQTRLYIENHFRAFAEAHQQIERIHFDYEEQLSNYAGEDDSYPIMYVIPLDSEHDQGINRLGFRVSFFDIIQKDRSNVSNLNNLVELLVNDFLRYYDKDGDAPFYFEDVATSNPLNNYLPDYCIGRYVEIEIVADSYSICSIPMADLPPIVVECLPASYTVEYVNGTLIQSGTIPSGWSETIQVPNPVEDLFLYLDYETGDDTITITIDANSAGTITTANTTGLTSVVYEVNAVVQTLPFTIANTDTLEITFDAAAADGQIILTGTY